MHFSLGAEASLFYLVVNYLIYHVSISTSTMNNAGYWNSQSKTWTCP